jgi:hypothetical protein
MTTVQAFDDIVPVGACQLLTSCGGSLMMRAGRRDEWDSAVWMVGVAIASVCCGQPARIRAGFPRTSKDSVS